MAEDDINRVAQIFFVNTRFQQMARRPGGVPRSQAIERAEATLEEMKAEFPEWLDHELNETIAVLQQLESHATYISELDDAYRRCYQLRNVAAAMDYALVAFVAEILCDLFDAIKDGGAPHEEAIECHIDALLFAAKPPYCRMRPDEVPDIADGLREILRMAKLPRSNNDT